jgi:hypothetical protein
VAGGGSGACLRPGLSLRLREARDLRRHDEFSDGACFTRSSLETEEGPSCFRLDRRRRTLDRAMGDKRKSAA